MDSQPLPRGKACLPCRCVYFKESGAFILYVANACPQRTESGSCLISCGPLGHADTCLVVCRNAMVPNLRVLAVEQEIVCARIARRKLDKC